ncbi:RGS domain-containing protein [Caenorhabditis elegans]|uniref:RGS domain-containing protein n=1 Tax=Caenorhabditis elegans TaxID=6239 RepID=G5ECK9_CAEEL|nr:RGS domain-containing protein [Caenorhabditis elegans]NP_508359.1 RGS domain-containing protein [Caenorhabditis elegans]CCD71641.1 RGS domain-containing protein [Caenorhabditis elegans]CCD71654.1 RGS domain-containing protein [Caenorhabditis elegans]|eukprot:NP_508356.1 Regulator of G protein Signaling [Caenorhabditis elegans]
MSMATVDPWMQNLPQITNQDFFHSSGIECWNRQFPDHRVVEENGPIKTKDALMILYFITVRNIRKNRNTITRIRDALKSPVSIFRRSPKLSLQEDVLSWQKSPESLAASEYGSKLFVQFLKQQTSADDVDFWLACAKHRWTEMTRDGYEYAAYMIYNTYVFWTCERKIDLLDKFCFVDDDGGTPRDVFITAQAYVGTKFPKDSHKKFLQDPIYLNFLHSVSSAANQQKK